MFNGLKQEWQQLKRGRPGQRFESQFDRNRKEAATRFGRVVRIVAGILLIPVGIFFLAFPGPGLVVIAIGLILIARESRMMARALDRSEMRARRTWEGVQQRRRRAAKS